MSVVTGLVCLSCFWIAAIIDLRGELPSFPNYTIPLVFSLQKAALDKSFIEMKSSFGQKLASSPRHPDLFSTACVSKADLPCSLIFHCCSSGSEGSTKQLHRGKFLLVSISEVLPLPFAPSLFPLGGSR